MNLDRLRELYQARRLDEARGAYEGRVDSQEAEWHFLGSLAASAAGEWYQARNAIERALFLPAAAETRVKVLHQAGFVFRFIGDLYQARTYFELCLATLDETPDLIPVVRGFCLYNLALTLEHTRDKQLAVRRYREAIVEFERESLTDHLRKAFQNLAWVACEVGQPLVAHESLDRAEPLCITEDATWRQRLVRAYLASVEGDRQTALLQCERILSADVASDLRCLAACIGTDIARTLHLWEPAALLIRVAQDLMTQGPLDSRCIAITSTTFERLQRARQETGA